MSIRGPVDVKIKVVTPVCPCNCNVGRSRVREPKGGRKVDGEEEVVALKVVGVQVWWALRGVTVDSNGEELPLPCQTGR